jgi:hypothetical protein
MKPVDKRLHALATDKIAETGREACSPNGRDGFPGNGVHPGLDRRRPPDSRGPIPTKRNEFALPGRLKGVWERSFAMLDGRKGISVWPFNVLGVANRNSV